MHKSLVFAKFKLGLIYIKEFVFRISNQLLKYIFIRVCLIMVFVSIGKKSQAQQGQVYESLTMPSKLLSQEVKYNIYLPPGYEQGEQDYPVVYLLHGNGDDHTSWSKKGKINSIADRAIKNQEIPPLVIVMPDAGNTYYVNDISGKVPYEDMFIQEFIPFIENEYRIKQEKKFRGIAGLSMGGYGGLLYAIKHPELFNACAALSAAIRSDEEIISLDGAGYERRYVHISGPGLKGTDRLTLYYRQHSILDLTKTIPVTELKKVNYYLDCGDDDHLTQGNASLHIQLTQLGIPHEYRSRNGGHDWNYWRSGIVDGLKFISESYR